LCDDTNSGDLEEVFNLTVNEPLMLNAFDETVTYYTTMAFAESGANPIPNPTAYTNTDPTQTIYVRVTNTGDPANPLDNGTGCYTIVSFDIIVNPLPATVPVDDIIVCELNTDGFYTFDLTVQTNAILNGQPEPDFAVTYYTTLAAAQSGTGFIVNPSAFQNTVNPQEIFVNITNTITGCDVATVSFFIEVQEAAEVNPNYSMYALCDDNMEFDGDPTNDTVEFDLLSQNTILLNGQNPANFNVTYYESQADAEVPTNAIDASSPYINQSNPQVIWVRIDNDTNANSICYDIKPLTLMVDPIPAFNLEDLYTICVNLNGTEVIGAPLMDTGLSTALYTFEWIEDGDTSTVLSTDSSYMPTVDGNYTVFVTDINNGCTSSDSTVVQSSSPPIVNATVTTEAFANNNVIEVTATGDGAAIFEFSIDNGPWLSNEPNTNTYTFSNVLFGEHVIQARDINGCGVGSDVVLVMDYPLFFTPNNDGYNDTWQIFGIGSQYDAKIFIFDRYGKLLKQLSPTGPGWDGTYNGELMPSNDYWFTIDYRELGESEGAQKQFRSHFALKR
jgi:gliding motility-associated-like protein